MKSKIQTYLKETQVEMKKVVWPDRRYASVATLIILMLVAITAVFVIFVDYAFAGLFRVLLK